MTCILVVDDDPSILLNTLAYLEDEGFEVLAAESPKLALEIITNKKIDVGIIDMRLPGIDGNELILQAHQHLPEMKFIIHTGSTDYLLPENLKSIGIQPEQIINKPVLNMDVFKETISKLL